MYVAIYVDICEFVRVCVYRNTHKSACMCICLHTRTTACTDEAMHDEYAFVDSTECMGLCLPVQTYNTNL